MPSVYPCGFLAPTKRNKCHEVANSLLPSGRIILHLVGMNRTNLIGYTESDMKKLMVSLGQKEFHGSQLFKWLYHSRQYDISLMSDLGGGLRDKLEKQYYFDVIKPVHRALSSDGTKKLLFELSDRQPIETVLIPDSDGRQTVCVSSQSGCALGCLFCATGKMGFMRDLTVGEIVGQLIYIRDEYGDDAFGNIVFMGMGEPLLNYKAVVEAVRIITSETGLGVSPKKVTISTSGISPKIRKLADAGCRAQLALSLHAATQEKRAKIMPVAEQFKLDKLMEAVRYYSRVTKSTITFEYILFDGFNDSMADVKSLTKLVQGLSCKINVLAFNPVEGLDFKRPSDDKVDWFGRQLRNRVPTVTIRKSRGLDIDAACGQLAARQLTGRKI